MNKMNKVDARRAYQIIARLWRENQGLLADIVNDLGFNLEDVDSILDSLRSQFEDELEECGGCGCYHMADRPVDCRDDDERF